MSEKAPAQEQWKTMEKTVRRTIGTVIKTSESKRPPVTRGGRQSHKSETRISTIADFGRLGKQEKKPLRSLMFAGGSAA